MLNFLFAALIALTTFAGFASAASEEEILKDVRVPAELSVTVFAAPPLVNYPVYVTAAPDGTLYVSSDRNGSIDRAPHRGSIIRLRDTDGDGRADERKVFVADVDSPRGAVWDHDRLYLVHPPHLSAFIDHNGDGVSDEQKILVKNIAFGFKDRPADHTTNGLTLGIDGWLYVAVGDFGFLEAEGADGRKLSYRHGGVVRVRPDGTELQIYAIGTRNILDLAMSPALDGFCRDNTNDGGGWDMRFHHFTGLEDHGYPRLYMNFPGEFIKPLAEYGGGSGCGGCYLNEPGFPDRYARVPLTCDWGRNFIYSHHLTPAGATFKDDCREWIGMTRVTDCDADGMSALYAASWKGATFTYAGEDVGYVVRVTPRGYTPEPLPDFAQAADPDLVNLLLSPSARRRMEAQRTLIRRKVDERVIKPVMVMAEDPSTPLDSRVAALFALKQIAPTEVARHLLAILAKDEALRPFAVRALADREADAAVPETRDTAIRWLGDLAAAAPRMKIEGAVALARLHGPSSERVTRSPHADSDAGCVVPLLGDSDPVVAHTAFQVLALMKAAGPCFAVVDDAGAPAARREGALFALMRMPDPAVVGGLITRLGAETDTARRRGLLSALCRLHFREAKWKGDGWGTRPDTRGPWYQPDRWEQSDKILTALREALTNSGGVEAAWLAAEMARNRIEDDSAVRQLIALAATDDSLRPLLLQQLTTKDRVPPDAVPLIMQTAARAQSSAEDRTTAILLLTKTDDAAAWHSLPHALSLFATGDRSKEAEKAAQIFLAAPKLENFHSWFEESAAKTDGAASLWAEAAVLALSARTTGAPEARELAAKSLESGWQLPARRAQILRAIALITHRAWSSRVLASLKDPDPSVATAASAAVAALRLDPAEADAPKIGSLKPEDVVAAVLKTKGDPEVGAQIFVQATCANCHTVKKDAPPRGPFLGNIADTYQRHDLAVAILDPNKTIAQGFVTQFFTPKEGMGEPVMGFVVSESATEVAIRNQAGVAQKIPVASIATREKLPHSLMPPALMNDLTVRDLASLLDYLQQLALAGKKQ